MTTSTDCDVLIIGSGAAGLSAALELATQAKVTVLSKATLEYCNTQYAQGGISAVLSEEDSFSSHVEDTLNAGGGLCDPEIVEFTVSQGPQRIAWLIEQGVPFSQVSDSEGGSYYHLTREGGHSHRRVIHADDMTGQAIISTLSKKNQCPSQYPLTRTPYCD
jgi:L-aspartate oxidase